MNAQQRNQFGLTPRDMQTIQKIFQQYPEVVTVHIFGSRAMGNFKLGSDIDLAIMNVGVTDATLRKIKSDFEDSSLPYRVDLLNFTELKNEDLRRHIERVGVGLGL